MNRRIIGWMVIAVMASFTTHAAMVAHYDFGDGSLTDDSSGNGHTLTLGGSLQNITANADGFSAHFDGSTGSSRFDADLVPTSVRSNTFTVSFWWKTATLNQATDDSLMSSVDNGQIGDWQIGDFNADIRLTGRTDSSLTIAQSALSTNTWYHMALVSDGTTATWYNTQQGSSLSEVGSVSKLFTLADLRIGGNRAGNLTYDSDIASVAVYYDALGTTELNTLLGSGPAAIPEPATLGLIGLVSLGLLVVRRFRI